MRFGSLFQRSEQAFFVLYLFDIVEPVQLVIVHFINVLFVSQMMVLIHFSLH